MYVSVSTKIILKLLKIQDRLLRLEKMESLNAKFHYKLLKRECYRLPRPIPQDNIALQLNNIIILGLINAHHQHHPRLLPHPQLIQPDSTVPQPSNTTTSIPTHVPPQHHLRLPPRTLIASTAHQPWSITIQRVTFAQRHRLRLLPSLSHPPPPRPIPPHSIARQMGRHTTLTALRARGRPIQQLVHTALVNIASLLTSTTILMLTAAPRKHIQHSNIAQQPRVTTIL